MSQESQHHFNVGQTVQFNELAMRTFAGRQNISEYSGKFLVTRVTPVPQRGKNASATSGQEDRDGWGAVGHHQWLTLDKLDREFSGALLRPIDTK